MSKDFKLLLVARMLFQFSVSMQAILLGWRMYEITHDALFLGLIGLAEAAPALGLALFAGLIVDHTSPLWTYRLVLGTNILSGVVMWASQSPSFGITTQQQTLGLFCAAFLTGLARSFSQPSIFAIIPRIPKRSNFSRTNAWLTATLQVARITGPAVGGLIYAGFGAQSASSVIISGLVLGLFALFLIKPLPAEKRADQKKESVKEKLLSGLKFVFRHPILFPAMTLDMVAVLFGGVTALLPIYAAEVLYLGPKGLGLLRASPALGAAVMSIWLTRFEITKKAGRYLLWSVFGFGLCMLTFSLSTVVWVSALALILGGALDSVSMVVRGTAVQLNSPDEMRGRISAVNSMFIGSSNELGELESGVAAKLMGTVPSAIFGSVVCILTVGLVAWRSKALRDLEFVGRT